MADLNVNSIGDASGGTTTTVNGFTPTVSNMAGRNLIINGAMQVWQRGTSSSSAGYQTADRFYHYGSNGFTHAQSTDVPANQGFTYSLSTTGTPSGEYNVGQSVELPADGKAGVFFNGQAITISYWAKSSVAGDKLWNAVLFRDSHGSSSNQVVIDFDNTDNSELTTSWARYTKTYTIGVDPNGTNKTLTLQIRSRNNAEDSSTPAGNISITGVQLEAGSVATPFEHRMYGQELALCQRYYETLNLGFIANGVSVVGGSGGFKVEKRATPTVATIGVGLGAFTAPATLLANSISIYIDKTASTNTGGLFSAAAEL